MIVFRMKCCLLLLFCFLVHVRISNCDSLFNGDTPRMVTSHSGLLDVGTLFYAQVAGSVTAVTFFATNITTNTGPHSCAMFHSNSTLLAQAEMANKPVDNAGWHRCDFNSDIRLVPNERYLAVLRTENTSLHLTTRPPMAWILAFWLECIRELQTLTQKECSRFRLL